MYGEDNILAIPLKVMILVLSIRWLFLCSSKEIPIDAISRNFLTPRTQATYCSYEVARVVECVVLYSSLREQVVMNERFRVIDSNKDLCVGTEGKLECFYWRETASGVVQKGCQLNYQVSTVEERAIEEVARAVFRRIKSRTENKDPGADRLLEVIGGQKIWSSLNFGKRFVPQQELSDEQAFWLQTSHPNTDQSASPPVKIEAPQELFKKGNGDIVNIVVNSSLDIITSVNVNYSIAMNDSVNYVEMCNKCLELEAELIKRHNMVEKDEYNRLSKGFSKLEQHCISLELAMQLNKEIFQKNNTSMNQTEPSFDQLFELNNLKAELQAKDITIEKLKENIKCLNKTSTTNSVKKDIDEIETINLELEHMVAKLLAENEHLKQTYK
ncbi:hypothetical protein Tco_1283466 [Tanacetum coccineum]